MNPSFHANNNNPLPCQKSNILPTKKNLVTVTVSPSNASKKRMLSKGYKTRCWNWLNRKKSCWKMQDGRRSVPIRSRLVSSKKVRKCSMSSDLGEQNLNWSCLNRNCRHSSLGISLEGSRLAWLWCTWDKIFRNKKGRNFKRNYKTSLEKDLKMIHHHPEWWALKNTSWKP